MRKITNSLRELPNIGEKFDFGNIKKASIKQLEKNMDVSFHFNIPQYKQYLLEQRVSNGDILTAVDIENNFSPDQTEVDNLIKWLTDNGFKNVRQSNDKCSVYATSNGQNISDKLECEMVIVSGESSDTLSAKTTPSLPSSISKNIHSINGLQPFMVRKKKGIRDNSTIRPYRNGLIANRKASNTPPFLPSTILTAYNGITSYTGINQTIGILIDTAPYNSDLIKFWQANGMPNTLSRVKIINTRNVTLPAPSGEESLDVEWTSGIAKDAKINVYCSGDLYFTSLDIALDRIYSDASSDATLRQISVSLGLGEKLMSAGELATENNKYLRLKALGVNCFVSSGDSGYREGDQVQVSFPASSPNVISVGGTRVILNSFGAISSETAWSGSGGGTSVKFTKAVWQLSSGSGRLVPDVSAPADPNTGAYVVLSGYVYQFGGTSWSAPVWAGICALINDARVKNGKSRIGFLPPLIYPYLGTNKFRDITNGNNGYPSTVGYDRVTGLGTPNINNLISLFA